MPDMPYRYNSQNPLGYKSPAERPALKNFRDITIDTQGPYFGPTLRGWFIQPQTGLSENTIVFFHENAGSLGLRMDYFETIISSLNVNILAIAYRGYSESDGYPNEAGLKKDGLVIARYI
jgi:hypothetical protein